MKTKTEWEYIVAGCQKNQPLAQKMLYDSLAPMMLGVCMRYTHSRDEAQDLLHDGFIKAFERIGNLRDANAVESWLYRIMVNVSINYVTRNCQLRYTDPSVLEAQNSGEELDGDELWADDKRFAMDQIVQAIQDLPEQYRLVFNMRQVEEMEYSEIAKQLGQQESSVRSSVCRARQMLRKKLLNLKSK